MYQSRAYLHKSTSKKAHRRMVMSGEPVQFPQARVFSSTIQGISLLGLVRLASLSTTEMSSSRRALWCVNMACLRFIFSRRVIVVFLVRGYVHEMFFLVVFLRAIEKRSVSKQTSLHVLNCPFRRSKGDWALVYTLFKLRHIKKSIPSPERSYGNK